jgi:competence protein ComEC
MPRRLSFPRLSVFEQPLVFIATSFISGLLFAARYSFSIRTGLIAAITLWLTASACLLMKRNGWIVTALLLISSCVSGCALWAINEASAGETSVRRLFDRAELNAEEPVEIWGTLIDAPEPAPDRIHLSIAVEKVATLGKELSASGIAQLVVPLRDAESIDEYDKLRLDYGTRVRALGYLNNRMGYRNPGAPDFDAMLEHRGFDATGVVKSPLLIETLGAGNRGAILNWLYRVRTRALSVTLRHFSQPASGILAAALFGNRHFLSRDTAETFRAGGTFHLLVISGLHVAMIAIVVLWLARMLSNSRIIQYSLVMALMWAYALMVGAQPSITRAVVMLSVALVGQLLFRNSAGANTLAGAAIALLAWQPRDIFNPGFQLSFLTVLIIVVLASPLYLRLKQIGQWQPSASTPYPPRVPQPLKWFAEVLFWDERAFRDEMRRAPIRYRLEKLRAAAALNRLRVQRAIAWVMVTLLTTTGVQIGLLPLMIHHFHRFSLVSPIANVIESALVFLLMIAGAAYLILHSMIGAWILKFATVVNAIGWLTVEAGKPLLAWRKASFRVPDFGQGWEWAFTAYFAAVLILIIAVTEWNPFRKGDRTEDARRRFIGRIAAATSTLTIIALGYLLIIHPFTHEFERGRLSVIFLDVGQGDAMLVAFPQGSLMLLDSGGRIGFGSREGYEDGEDAFVEDRLGIAEAAVMPYLWRRGIKRLDWIAASHGHPDHVEGFAEIVRSFEIGRAIRPSSPVDNPLPDLFDQSLRSSGLPLWRAKRGEDFAIDGVRVEILSPPAPAEATSLSENNQSLVLRISFGNRSFLLTGDIEREAEEFLVSSDSDLRADVLKVAHHGSKTSSTAEFLEKVKPQHAVISVAKPSPFGHPHSDAMERLKMTGARILQTSECGAITISTDGSDLRVETFINCRSGEQSGNKASRSFRE